MKPRIYTDTSVIGGCYDEEFRGPSNRLLDSFSAGSAGSAGRATLVVSDLTLLELERAPDEVRAVLARVPPEHRENVELSEEAAGLAERYIQEGAIRATSRADARHIAIATVARVDVLVSWNFKHIVNLQRIHAYNSVNLRDGYPVLEIRSPMEVWSDAQDDD